MEESLEIRINIQRQCHCHLFLLRDVTHKTVYAVARCLSVRLSQPSIVL